MRCDAKRCDAVQAAFLNVVPLNVRAWPPPRSEHVSSCLRAGDPRPSRRRGSRFYERCGFTTDGQPTTVHLEVDGGKTHPVELIRYEKRLVAPAAPSHSERDLWADLPWEALATALSQPPPEAQPVAAGEERVASQAATVASVSHALDLRLRKLTAARMQDAAALEPKARAALARSLADGKKAGA
jgi:hypothetical protein